MHVPIAKVALIDVVVVEQFNIAVTRVSCHQIIDLIDLSARSFQALHKVFTVKYQAAGDQVAAVVVAGAFDQAAQVGLRPLVGFFAGVNQANKGHGRLPENSWLI